MGIGYIPDPRPHLTRAALRLVALVILLCAAGAVCCGCPSPRLPAVEGCTPRASMCRNDAPHVCSSSGRWHAVGDLACGAVSAVCVEGDAGVAHCAPISDAGVAHD